MRRSKTWLEGSSENDDSPEFLDRHYTLKELSVAWNMTQAWLKELFDAEPDVIILRKSKKMADGSTRVSKIYRIPAPVARRVYRRLVGPKKRAPRRPALAASEARP